MAASYIQAVGGATPPPPPSAVTTADCPQGELPHLARSGFEAWFGRDNVAIEPGATHTYCFTLNETWYRIAFAVGDRTGSNQCFTHVAKYIPPTGSGWETRHGDGTNSAAEYQSRGRSVPMGVWRIEITAGTERQCANKYQVVAHP